MNYEVTLPTSTSVPASFGVRITPRGPKGDQGDPGPPGSVAEIDDHIAAAEPHPAYDDLPSFTLLFENGLP